MPRERSGIAGQQIPDATARSNTIPPLAGARGAARAAGGILVSARASPYNLAPAASWRSGYAADCKSAHAGSIPAEASIKSNAFHIGRASQDVAIIDPAIIVAVKPLHGGLPTKNLGLRPGMIARLKSEGVRVPLADCLVLFRLAEFTAWVNIERLKGQWPSQLTRGMKLSGRRGRPQRVVERALDLARRKIDAGEWSTSEPVSRLAAIANQQLSKEGKRPISDDTFARAVDRLYIETGEARYKRCRRCGGDLAP
jgi:hypothetical protein